MPLFDHSSHWKRTQKNEKTCWPTGPKEEELRLTEGRGLSLRSNILLAAEASSWAEPQECATHNLCHGRVSPANSGNKRVEDDVKRHPEDPIIRFPALGVTPVDIGLVTYG